MRRLQFFGASDDLFACYDGDKYVEEIDCWKRMVAFKVSSESDGGSLVVTAAYNIDTFPHDCWVVGVSNAERYKPIPSWPVSYGVTDDGGSPTLILSAPSDAVVEPWEPNYA